MMIDFKAYFLSISTCIKSDQYKYESFFISGHQHKKRPYERRNNSAELISLLIPAVLD
jgi:hypothetical protein